MTEGQVVIQASMRIAAYALTVLLLVSHAATLRGDTVWRIDGAELLIDIPLTPAAFPEPDATLVFDASAAYLAAPGGLYKLDLALTPGSLERIAFPGESVRNAYMHDGALYVLKMTAENRGPALDHGFFRSTDGGRTLVPLDTELEDCNGEWCRFMTAGEALFAGDRIFLTAGGNVIVTEDEGESWHALRGGFQSQACYEPTIHLDGSRLFVGGECPLDVAFLEAGVLDASGVAWERQPSPLVTPWLENRKIQFITRDPGSGDFYVGTEGGLLKSDDDAGTFDWSLFRAIQNDRSYPYVSEILFPTSKPGVVITAGFDKATAEPWLAISSDGGGHWLGGSSVLRKLSGYELSTVVFLVEDPAGRILAGLLESENRRLAIVALRLEPGGRARPTRR